MKGEKRRRKVGTKTRKGGGFVSKQVIRREGRSIEIQASGFTGSKGPRVVTDRRQKEGNYNGTSLSG